MRPSPEPLAKLIPDDNWYVHCKNLGRLLELGDLFDQWGTNLIRAYEVHSKDYQLKQRYEKQLCIKSTWMGKKLGPFVVRGLAVTGNYPGKARTADELRADIDKALSLLPGRHRFSVAGFHRVKLPAIEQDINRGRLQHNEDRADHGIDRAERVCHLDRKVVQP